jgi:nicotinate-nucleotide pyrophosphorylase
MNLAPKLHHTAIALLQSERLAVTYIRADATGIGHDTPTLVAQARIAAVCICGTRRQHIQHHKGS